MQCEERLADFMLDELPSTDAVLVQEHINICVGCRQRYRELKDTGKALETVKLMTPVKPSANFSDRVMNAVKDESRKRIAALTPEKKLELDLREATRRDREIRKPKSANSSIIRQTKNRLRLWAVVAIMAVAIAGVAVILAFQARQASALSERRPLWRLEDRIGGIQQASHVSGKNTRHWVEAVLQKDVFSGDELKTDVDGAAFLESVHEADGTRLFIGPDTHVVFAPKDLKIQLHRGWLGFEKSAFAKASFAGWTVAAKSALVRIADLSGAENGSGVWIRVVDEAVGASTVVIVTAGSADVALAQGGQKTRQLAVGEKITIEEKALNLPDKEHLDLIPLPYGWRAVLTPQNELVEILGFPCHISERAFIGIKAIFECGGTGAKKSLPAWHNEAQVGWTFGADGFLSARKQAKMTLGVPLTIPLELSVAFRTNASAETLLLGLLDDGKGQGVFTEIAGRTAVEVREKNNLKKQESIERKTIPGRVENLRVGIRSKPGLTPSSALEYFVELESAGETIKPIPLSARFAEGDVWLSPQTEDVKFEQIKVSGNIPVLWLQNRLIQTRKTPDLQK
jgi:hypothetical protein